MYVYIQTEPQLWTVGFYDPGGKFVPESDWGTADSAADRVHWLNGRKDNAEEDIEPMTHENIEKVLIQYLMDCSELEIIPNTRNAKEWLETSYPL